MAKSQGGIKGVACIRCGAIDSVKVDVATLDFSCSECSEDFTANDVHDFLSKWKNVLTWCDMARNI